MSDQDTTESASAYVVGTTDDVSEGSPLVTEVGDTHVAVFYNQGEYFALNNTCPHQGGPLGQGKVEDDCVFCPWHGWQFDLETGEHAQGDDQAETYRVSVADDEITVHL